MTYESGDLPVAGTGASLGVPDHEELIVPCPHRVPLGILWSFRVVIFTGDHFFVFPYRILLLYFFA